MSDVDPLAQLTGPGGQFEIVIEDVVGHPMQVYKQRMRSLRDLMAQNAPRTEVDFVVQGDVRFTYGEHDRSARTLAASLSRLGVQRGDRVALCSANNPEWVITWWACAILGATLVPLNAWWKAEELEFGLNDSRAKVLIADTRRLDSLRDRLPEIRELEHVFEIGSHEFAALLDGDDPGMPTTPIDEDDVLAILYTSGTTGQPKGATVTHRQALANLQNIIVLGVANAMRGMEPRDTDGVQSCSLLVVPFFHVTGCLSTMMVVYATGGKLALMPVGRFDPDVAMQVIEREKVTAIGGVPTIMWRILESPNLMKYDLSSVKHAVGTEGAPAAPELVERIEQVFPHMRKTLTTAYGLTETASVATAHGGDDYFAHPGSVGRAAPTVELKVVDDAGGDVPPGERGEIWIKGPTVMAHGYWRRPDANEAAFTEGWFHTGDIGYLDADGFLFLVDRAKDMIIRAGENVYSVEIEHVLFDHPDVIDAAVVGVPHRTLGEEVKAVVQVRDGADVSPEDIQAFCRKHLADFKVPAYVDIRSEPLPRNPAGKVLKNLLRGNETSFAASDDQAL